jgi:hypothetical protein
MSSLCSEPDVLNVLCAILDSKTLPPNFGVADCLTSNLSSLQSDIILGIPIPHALSCIAGGEL